MKQAMIHNMAALDYAGTEALNTICSNLSFTGRDMKKIAITSCSAGAGKSYLSMQIMRNMAKRGKRVVLVDADLRRSFTISHYDIRTNGEWTGLVHYLAGYCEIVDIVYETNMDGACFIPVGRDIANPIPLLDTPYFGALLDVLVKNFDVVLIDTPPLGAVIDAAEIASKCDGVVLVVEYNKTRRREIMQAREQIAQSGCTVLGCIINQVTYDSLHSKRYYGRSYYNNYYYKRPYAKESQAKESRD